MKCFKISALLLLALMVSCKAKLSEKDKFLLEYAELEDTYANARYMDCWKLNDVYDENCELWKETRDINYYAQEVKNYTRLQGDALNFSDIKIPYPFAVGLNSMSDSSIDLKVSVFVPDKSDSLVLLKNDIGQEKQLDSLYFKLLKVQDNCAVLIIEDKRKKYDYAYSYDIRREKKAKDTAEVDDGNNANKEKAFLGYVDSRSEISKAGTSQRVGLEDESVSFQYPQYTYSVIGKNGKPLLTTDSYESNDVRHYLWYRNHDMPYQELLGSYISLKMHYDVLGNDTSYMYYPVYAMYIRAYGDIDKIKINFGSKKGKVLSATTGAFKVDRKDKKEKEFLPIKNYTEKELAALIKVHQNNEKLFRGENDFIKLYTSAPQTYNTYLYNTFGNSGFNISFADTMSLITEKGYSVKLNEDDWKKDESMNNAGHTFGYMNTIVGVTIPRLSQKIVKVRGAIVVQYPYYVDSVYSVNNLPAFIKYNAAANSLTLDDIDTYINKDVKKISVWDTQDKMVSYKERTDSDGLSVRNYIRPISKVILQFKLEPKEMIFPFEIPVK